MQPEFFYFIMTSTLPQNPPAPMAQAPPDATTRVPCVCRNQARNA